MFSVGASYRQHLPARLRNIVGIVSDGPVRWTPGASAVMRAIRRKSAADGTISHRDILLAIASETEPGESQLGRLIRDPTVWPHLTRVMQDAADLASGHARTPAFPIVSSKYLYAIELEAEEFARRDGVRAVGERHVWSAIGLPSVNNPFGLNPATVQQLVTEREIGHMFSRQEIETWWHALIETTILVQYQGLDQIPWLDVTGSSAVMLWVPGSVLNELDYLTYSGDTARVRDRARTFAKWLFENRVEAYGKDGVSIRDGGRVRLRAWSPVSMGGLRDTDHLEAAIALAEHGVPISVVTADIGLLGRAHSAGIRYLRLDTKFALPSEPSPRDREEQLRLRRANLEAPPQLYLSGEIRSTGHLRITNGTNGGYARETVVRWRPNPRITLDVGDRTAGLSGRSIFPGDLEGWYQHQVPIALPPGVDHSIAEFGFYGGQPPASIEYRIWATGMPPVEGQLALRGDRYVDESREQSNSQG